MKPKGIAKRKNVVFHYDGDGRDNVGCREIGRKFGVKKIKPFTYNMYAVVDVYVGIHRNGITSEEFSIRRDGEI